MNNPILTPQEIKKFLNLDNDFPSCDVRDIRQVVDKEVRDCIGNSFWQVLEDDLADYSDAENYIPGDEYTEGTVVAYNGTYWIAKRDTSAEIGSKPTDDWGLAPKFSTECYETFWCWYLGEYLSWGVLKRRMPLIIFKFKATGVVKLAGVDFEAISSKDMTIIMGWIDSKISETMDNLDYYARNNNSTHCFDKYKGIGIGICSNCGCSEGQCNCVSIKAEDNEEYYFG